MNFKNIITLVFLILSMKFVYCQEDIIPEKFIIHKVKKGDNLFNLAKKYNITESQIEIYNSRISKKGLRRRMQLRIPIYAKIEIENKSLTL
jgi:LysM repeat protein